MACGWILDFRNNVLYNWDESYAGYNHDADNKITRMNFMGNYYKQGPDSDDPETFWEQCDTARAYFSDNWMNGTCPSDPWSLVRFDGFTYAQKLAYKQSSPIPFAPVDTDDAETAYERAGLYWSPTHHRLIPTTMVCPMTGNWRSVLTPTTRRIPATTATAMATPISRNTSTHWSMIFEWSSELRYGNRGKYCLDWYAFN